MTDAADGGQRDSAAVGTAPPQARVPVAVLAEHRAAVAAISEAYAALPPGSPVRLAKRTSNLFRFRDPLPGRVAGSRGRAPSTGTGGLDASAFTRVLHVDPGNRAAIAGGTTTYEHLADATLRHGLMPAGVNTRQVDPTFPVRYLLENRNGPLKYVMTNSFGFGGSNCTLIFGRAG